jgi:hypothetical protein
VLVSNGPNKSPPPPPKFRPGPKVAPKSLMALIDAPPSDSTLFPRILKVGGYYKNMTTGQFRGTLFFPTDAAINKLLAEVNMGFLQLLANVPLTYTIARHHLTPIILPNTTWLSNAYVLPTLVAGKELTFTGA